MNAAIQTSEAPRDPAPDYLVPGDAALVGAGTGLRTGAQYRESLKDGRHVIIDGRDVTDVTAEPTLARGIDTIAGYMDAQHDPALADDLTTVDPATGMRYSTAWLVPRSVEDLRAYDRMIRASTFRTFGMFGRPPDYGPVKAVSFVAWNHLVRQHEPDALPKIERFLQVGRAHNLISADVIIDVQTDRRRPMPEQPGRLRVVEERRGGIVLRGAKAANSVLAQGNIGSISMPPPNPTMPDECAIWTAIPAGAPGLRLLLRGSHLSGTEDSEDSPLGSGGEEADGLLLFDDVFVPWDYVFSYRNRMTPQIYTTLGQFAFWKIGTRLSYRAELFAAAAQLIVDALGTDQVPAVRAMVADVIAYAVQLRGLMTLAMEKGSFTDSGVMLPHHTYVTAGRLLSIEQLPRIMQTLRELSGQGLISRVPRATWERADLGPLLDEYLPGHKLHARDKNRLFNLVWDMTSSSAAMRVALFENVNATPAAALKEELYRSYDRSEGLAAVRARAGIV
ncbi:4-hydroxyphenylacetate 3-hydroxylase N-terminal domain-containing protein [Zavarzinia sp. CC-PAN008]|uniref:4-hydroxyphenylacetate 3-hydroxylase N-terminal domain-containing protein n=1 Tax=Zavarzinia sp. CC-PAN008 TaxID=3243332 RepID=UPI003F743A34